VVLGVALLTSLVCAMVVTWLVSRPLRRSLNELTDGARELSRGHYSHRVRAVGGGSELDTFAAAFNTMAVRLDDVEATRRRLLTDLAHELRTPIATLTLYHEGLYDGITDLNADTRNVLTAQTARLARLAEDIDDVSRAEEGRLRLDRQLHQVQELITTTTDSVRARYADKGVDLVVDVASDSGLSVKVDSARIGQVLGNLLTNALRHTPQGGRVTITTRPEPDEVANTDTGEGILPAQLPPRLRTLLPLRHRPRPGPLRLRHRPHDQQSNHRRHGGTITAQSDGPNHGATLEILLPRGGGARSRGAAQLRRVAFPGKIQLGPGARALVPTREAGL
jgi:two-component system sensor histidine kinase BaeS